MGPIAAIGIVKGKPFAPDARMRKIMTEALAVGQRDLAQPVHRARAADWFYYPARRGRTSCSSAATSSRRRSR